MTLPRAKDRSGAAHNQSAASDPTSASDAPHPKKVPPALLGLWGSSWQHLAPTLRAWDDFRKAPPPQVTIGNQYWTKQGAPTTHLPQYNQWEG